MNNPETSQKSEGKHCSRVLMIGPDKRRKGGIAAIIGLILENWDHEQHELMYIASANDTSKLGKLLQFLWSLLEFCYRLITWRPEIVHIHFSWKASFARKAIIVTLAKIFQIKLILHCHASRFDLFYAQNSRPAQQLIRWILNMADLLLVVSYSWEEYFQSLRLTTPVFVLHNSVTCSSSDLSYQNREPIVLTLGRLGHSKGTYDILQTIPQVLASYPETQFWLAGDGDIDKVQTVLSNQSWGSHVKLLGWIEGEKKDQALRQGRIFLFPSYHEGLPIAILEAMVNGLPVISCPVGGIGEVVSDHNTGFLVEPGDVEGIVEKLLLLLGNEILAQEFGEAGRKLVCEKFNILSFLQRLYVIYDSILVGTIINKTLASSGSKQIDWI